MGQDLQLPQLQTIDLPCFFFFTMLTMIALTIAINTAQMIIVQILFTIHWSICSSPFITPDAMSGKSWYSQFMSIAQFMPKANHFVSDDLTSSCHE